MNLKLIDVVPSHLGVRLTVTSPISPPGSCRQPSWPQPLTATPPPSPRSAAFQTSRSHHQSSKLSTPMKVAIRSKQEPHLPGRRAQHRELFENVPAPALQQRLTHDLSHGEHNLVRDRQCALEEHTGSPPPIFSMVCGTKKTQIFTSFTMIYGTGKPNSTMSSMVCGTKKSNSDEFLNDLWHHGKRSSGTPSGLPEFTHTPPHQFFPLWTINNSETQCVGMMRPQASLKMFRDILSGSLGPREPTVFPCKEDSQPCQRNHRGQRDLLRAIKLANSGNSRTNTRGREEGAQFPKTRPPQKR